MADQEPSPQKATEGFPDAAKANAETIAKFESQGTDTPPSQDLDTGSALDAMRAKKEAEVAKTASEVDDEVVVVEPKKDGERPPAPTEEEKAAAEKAMSGDKLFDGIELPPKASPRSAEAFASIKIKAAQEIAKRDEELSKVKADLEEVRKVTANALTPELEKEINELREFRVKLDIEADPKFKEFDRRAEGAANFIYSRLKANGVVTDEIIKSIKGYGGPANVDMEKIFEKITDPQLKRLVENKLVEIETAAFDKEQAIDRAKADVHGYVTERQKQNEQVGQAHQSATKAQLDTMMQNMKWLAPRKTEAGAKDEEKKAVETHNAFVKELNAEIGEALKDDSAQMRATLIAGTAQLLYLQQVHSAALGKTAELERQLVAANDFIAKYKRASGSGLKESAAPPSGKVAEVRNVVDFNTPPTQSLDDLAKKIMDERRAKSVA
jgi:hypothetical protein